MKPRNPHALAAKRAVPAVIPDNRKAKVKRAARKAAAIAAGTAQP